MKKLSFLLAALLFIISCIRQENKAITPVNRNNTNPPVTLGTEVINDSIFENVIEIRISNVVTTGTDYLFDVSIPASIKTPVLYISAEVPLDLLPTIYPEFQKLIIITPDWALIKDTSFSSLEKRKPGFIIYKFNRSQGSIVKDSLVVYKFPEMKFAKKHQLKDNQKEFYYAEGYGSFCCPKDRQYENKPAREEFIKLFEKENNVKITNTYRHSYGKEGEHSYLYPLDGLSNLLKLKFILDRDFYRIINRENKDIIKTPGIYTPFILEINDRTKKI